MGIKTVSLISLFSLYFYSLKILSFFKIDIKLSLAALILIFGTLANIFLYKNPYLTDSFHHMILILLMYFLLKGNALLFGIFAILGILGRETIIFIVPAFFITGKWKESILILLISLTAFFLPKFFIEGGYILFQEKPIFGFIAKMYLTWGPVGLIIFTGLTLVPKDLKHDVFFVFLGLFTGAGLTALMVLDITRMYTIILPAALITAAFFLQKLYGKNKLIFYSVILLSVIHVFSVMPTTITQNWAENIQELEEYYFNLKYFFIAFHITSLLLISAAIYTLKSEISTGLQDIFNPKIYINKISGKLIRDSV